MAVLRYVVDSLKYVYVNLSTHQKFVGISLLFVVVMLCSDETVDSWKLESIVTTPTWRQLGYGVAFRDVSATNTSIDGFGIPTAWPISVSDTIPPSRQSALSYCFAPGTPPEIMEAFTQATQPSDDSALAFFAGNSWSGIATPKHLTWSLVPDGITVPSTGINDNLGDPAPSELFARMDALFAGNRALWIGLIEQMFDRWSQLTGVTYSRVTLGSNDWDDGGFFWASRRSATRGDIRIAMRNIDNASNVIAFNFFPTIGDMVLDRSENWAQSSNNFRFLRNVLMHEHGHALGLSHVCSSDTAQLMEPFINLSFDGLQHDDLRGGHRQHGDPFEPNDNAATASDLGLLAIGSSTTLGSVPAPPIANSSILSIETDGRNDWFSFTVDSPASVSVTITPVGRTYDSSPQVGRNCTSGNPVDSLRMANLDFTIFDVDAVTTLVTANAQPVGMVEQVLDVPLFDAGEYFVRVFESNNPLEPQLYFLNITIGGPPLCANVNCDDGLFCNGVETCDQGNCVAGVAPCPVDQICDEALQQCSDPPGACCRTNGLCEIRNAIDCPASVGSYFGNGTLCDEPGNPTCDPVPTAVSCQLTSPSAFPGGEVTLELFVENVADLAWYHQVVDLSFLTGSGSVAPSCPDGISVDTTRTDYVFAGLSTSLDIDCPELGVGSFALSGAANVAAIPRYLGEYQITIPADTAPGSQLVMTVLDDPTVALLRAEGFVQDIPFRSGLPCTLNILDASACLAPTVEALGPRYLAITPAAGDFPVALRVQGSPNSLNVSCVSSFVQIDGTLGDMPIYQLPSQWGTALVKGQAIVPSVRLPNELDELTSYLVSADCLGATSGSNAVSTWVWGDSTNDGLLDILDVVTSINAYTGDLTNTTVESSDVVDCNPDGIVDLLDIQSIIDALTSQPYQPTCASPCP